MYLLLSRAAPHPSRIGHSAKEDDSVPFFTTLGASPSWRDSQPAAPRARSRETTSGSAFTNASMSSSVVDHPTDTRSERSASTPMASSTGDGSSDSDEQALPEW